MPLISNPTLMKKLEYKIELIQENSIATVFLGASKLPLEMIEEALNRNGAEGWELVFQTVESRRFWLFWTKEAVIITFARERK